MEENILKSDAFVLPSGQENQIFALWVDQIPPEAGVYIIHVDENGIERLRRFFFEQQRDIRWGILKGSELPSGKVDGLIVLPNESGEPAAESEREALNWKSEGRERRVVFLARHPISEARVVKASLKGWEILPSRSMEAVQKRWDEVLAASEKNA